MVTSAAPSITLRGLAKTFRAPSGPVPAVAGIDLDIPAGQMVALLGPNGAGKSTTIDMLLGLSKPDAGSVAVFGLPPARAVAAGRIGAMLQVGELVRYLNVRELLDMVAGFYPHPLPVEEAIALAGVGAIAGRRTHKLSGGQTQRVRAAVALVTNPDLLVLDEPTAALDVEARREFWATMREFSQRGKTILFATHYLEEADEYAERVILMAHGRIVADGSPEQVKATVGQRTIRATLPGTGTGPLAGVLRQLPGVIRAEASAGRITLACADSDAALRALLADYPAARDIEVTGASIEAAFLALTADGADEPSTGDAGDGSTDGGTR